MTFKSAWILGSTSTTAQAIICELAKQGCLHFHLIARDTERNQAFSEELSAQNDLINITTEYVDLENISSTPIDPPASFDLYLITAGCMGNADLARVNSAQA